MKQISLNKKFIDFEKIARSANFDNLNNFVKICDFCGELFVADIGFIYQFKGTFVIKCPICFSNYCVVWNELNDFCYLEFAKSPEDYVCAVTLTS